MDETPAPVDFDLGELTQGPEPEPPRPPLPMRERLGRLGLLSWRAAWVAVALALVAASIGWQIGGTQARTAAAERLASKPPVLAWIIDDGPNGSSSPSDPHTILELHVANLGSRAVRVNSVVPQTDRGSARATILGPQPVTIEAGQTTSTDIEIHPDCGGTYAQAALQVLISAPPGRTANERLVIDDTADPSLGNSFLLALNQVCARPTADRTENGVDGVFVEQTSSALGAALVLTNGTPNPRKVSFSTLESDGFRLQTSPGAPIVLRPGDSISVFLTIKVDGCDGVGRLSNWAEGVSMQVTSAGSGTAVQTDVEPPDQYSLRDVMLAPLGAAVQKACG
jgi:hypothetical protein